MFTKYEVLAVGCSLGIERVFAIMEKNKDKNQVLVTRIVLDP